MVNVEEFSKRLQEVLDFYGLSASSFADRIGVQRSSISHILSGRNKPSLDFILKILHAFPDVELYWLLNGKGVFPADKKNLRRKRLNRLYLTNPLTCFPHPGQKTLRLHFLRALRKRKWSVSYSSTKTVHSGNTVTGNDFSDFNTYAFL